MQERLTYAWRGYFIVTAGIKIPAEMWSHLFKHYPPLYEEALKTWNAFCKCWRNYVAGKIGSGCFDRCLMAWGRTLLACYEAYCHGGREEQFPTIARYFCKQCKFYKPAFVDREVWGQCTKGEYLFPELAGCPGWEKAEERAKSKPHKA